MLRLQLRRINLEGILIIYLKNGLIISIEYVYKYEVQTQNSISVNRKKKKKKTKHNTKIRFHI